MVIEESMMKPVFFYGLFMDPELLRKQGYHPSGHQVSKLEKYKLCLGERATLIRDQTEEVWGIVMNLSEIELERLYSARSVAEYNPISVKCITEDSEEIIADVYILPEGYKFNPPKDAVYARQLYSICQKLSLPTFYLQALEDIIIKIEKSAE